MNRNVDGAIQADHTVAVEQARHLVILDCDTKLNNSGIVAVHGENLPQQSLRPRDYIDSQTIDF